MPLKPIRATAGLAASSLEKVGHRAETITQVKTKAANALHLTDIHGAHRPLGAGGRREGSAHLSPPRSSPEDTWPSMCMERARRTPRGPPSPEVASGER